MKNALLFTVLTLLSISLHAQCDQHQSLIDKVKSALNDKNADLLAEAYHENAIRHSQMGDEKGLTKIVEEAEKFYVDVPDASSTFYDMVCSGDKVYVRWEGKGTHKDTGKKLSVTGITLFHIKDGKIVEEWEEMSALSLMQQLGMELKPAGGGK